MTDDRVATIIGATSPDGRDLELDFQSYWVQHGASPPVHDIRYEGADEATPAEGVLTAIEGADVILICPSNPIASIFPILAVPGIRGALEAKRDSVVGVSPIVAGAPVRGMADKLMPAAGYGVTAAEAARCYEGLLSAWVIDERDRNLAPQIEAIGLKVAVADTIMLDDEAAERIARVALDLL